MFSDPEVAAGAGHRLARELKRFDGVCILLTEKYSTLGREVGLHRPQDRLKGANQGAGPRTMGKDASLRGIGGDVDLDSLAKRQLAGSEIRNVLFNAVMPFGEARTLASPWMISKWAWTFSQRHMTMM